MAKESEMTLTEISFDIKDKIYTIRGVPVMLDSDLAQLYKTDTSSLNRQVKRNIERFPPDFCFQLTLKEVITLKCQIGIAKTDGRGGRRPLPDFGQRRALPHRGIHQRCRKESIRDNRRPGW